MLIELRFCFVLISFRFYAVFILMDLDQTKSAIVSMHRDLSRGMGIVQNVHRPECTTVTLMLDALLLLLQHIIFHQDNFGLFNLGAAFVQKCPTFQIEHFAFLNLARGDFRNTRKSQQAHSS